MSFRSIADMIEIENECAFNDLGLPKTLYSMLSNTAGKFQTGPRLRFNFSGPKIPQKR